MEDRDSYILGTICAILSSLFIGSSFIYKKIALKRIGSIGNVRASAGGLSYLKQWMWWIGLALMAVGEAANCVAYAFAPAALVTPLGALSVLVTAVLSSKYLNEKLNSNGKNGCFLCIVGSIIIVLFSPKSEDISSFSELLTKLSNYLFVSYVCVIVVMSIIIKLIFIPKFGNTSVVVYLLLCSGVGSLTIVFIKAVSIGLKETITTNKNNLYDIMFWILLVATVACIVIQINYLNKSLDLFNSNVVTPVYYVMFTVLVIMTTGILFKEWEAMTYRDIVGCFCGFIIVVDAIFMLNLSKDISSGNRTLWQQRARNIAMNET